MHVERPLVVATTFARLADVLGEHLGQAFEHRERLGLGVDLKAPRVQQEAGSFRGARHPVLIVGAATKKIKATPRFARWSLRSSGGECLDHVVVFGE
jgi:hypothetical protein